MLQGINRMGRSWLGKVVVAILFGFLILSFAVWGIGDIFRGNVRTTVASVGSSEISAEAFRTAYQSEIQRLMRQTRQSITPERARALGLDTQILGRLVTEAALDQRAKALGLAVSDEMVARTITEDQSFRGANGRFDRSLFQEVLRSNNLSEPAFVREQRNAIARMQIAEAVTGALNAPLPAREALHRYLSERRSASYFTLPASSLRELPAPTEQQVQSYFEANKAAFRAPEYRAVNVLMISPEALAKPEEVSDADAQARYEQVKGSRFGSPERRTLQQIVFPSSTEAEAAFNRVKENPAAFEAIAREKGLDPATLDLGALTRAEMLDAAVADAAFALAEGAVSGPVQGRFGPVLVRAVKIEPERVRPYSEVAAEVRRDLALERARERINTVHDEIEDLRASARPLTDIARAKGLPLITFPAVDRSGRDKDGKLVEMPDREAVLTAAFGADIGADTEALRTRGGGYAWFEVTNIEPARDKALADVREAVVSQWRTEEAARLLAEKARVLVERIDKGESVEAVAAELGLQATSVADLARGSAKGELTNEIVTRIFATPVGKAASAAGGDARTVFKVTSAASPPFMTTTPDAANIDQRLALALSDDLLSELIAKVQQEVGVSIYQQNLRRAVGGEL